ncbi:hypothetical protein EIP91_011948 [Steccherinum ochraceum]|uniref:F-box domain-containing protein n=1 Tax=Steccherinum ochraceum TaxID=92696 RepID=A0A4R0RKV0_9APHY|nr:hypothetical protein EIP91_011948 [Steccherinum ochraceum]
MAQCCKSFYDPAMDLLWHVIPNIAPVIRCLPPDALQVAEFEPDKYNCVRRIISLTPGRELDAKDWRRALLNASRVKEITSEWYGAPGRADGATNDSWEVSPDIFQAFGRYSRSDVSVQCLLPNVWRFEGSESWEIQDAPQILVDLAYLVDEKLTTLWLHEVDMFQSDEDTVNAVIGPIIKRYKYLQDIQFYLVHPASWSAQSIIVFTELLASLSDVRFLRTNLPLRRISPDQDAVEVQVKSPVDAFLPCLQELRMELPDRDISAGLSCIQDITSRELKELWVICAPTTTTHNFQVFFKTLARRRFPLRELKVHVRSGADEVLTTDNIESHFLFPITMSPLFTLQDLSHIELHMVLATGLTDEFMLNLARAWPRLWYLSVKSDLKHVAQPSLTLEGLLPLSELCPRLDTLNLSFHATLPSAGAIQRAKEIRRKAHRFKRLGAYFTCAPSEDDPERLADFLLDMFPRIYSFHLGDTMAEQSVEYPEAISRWERLQHVVLARQQGMSMFDLE